MKAHSEEKLHALEQEKLDVLENHKKKLESVDKHNGNELQRLKDLHRKVGYA